MMGELKNVNETVETTPEIEEIQYLKAKLRSTRLTLLLTTLIIFLFVACTFQQRALVEQTEKEAYLLSVVITEYEDILLLKYETTPYLIGLGDYREAWINNPCRETAFSYYTKISEAVEMLEKGIFPDEPIGDGIKGNLLTV